MLFFDKLPAAERPLDGEAVGLRPAADQPALHPEQNPLRRPHLEDFVDWWARTGRSPVETERFREIVEDLTAALAEFEAVAAALEAASRGDRTV